MKKKIPLWTYEVYVEKSEFSSKPGRMPIFVSITKEKIVKVIDRESQL